MAQGDSIAVITAIGRPMRSTSSVGALAATQRRLTSSSKALTSRGNQAVDKIAGANISVVNSFVGKPYQPTTSGRVIAASMAASIHRYVMKKTPNAQ